MTNWSTITDCFQLEFNFRDAKQYWGLEDFMVVNSIPVHNSANLAFFMVNLSQALIRPLREQCPAFSVNDLKAEGKKGSEPFIFAIDSQGLVVGPILGIPALQGKVEWPTGRG
ncbi:MAG: hypothetical protein ACFCVA_05910 [Gammaproteobacteria bacterium]